MENNQEPTSTVEQTDLNLPNLEGQELQENSQTTDISDEAVLNFFKSKGREIDSLDSLFSEPERIVETKEVDPWDGVLDEEDKAYLNYKKETGRGRKDYEFLKKDFNTVSPLEFAREQVLKDSGVQLTPEQVDEYLEEKLGITDMENLSTTDYIELSKYGKAIKDLKIEQQEKYKAPVQSSPNQNLKEEFITLSNGSMMKKEDFESLQNNQQEHLRRATEAVNSVTASTFKTVIDDDGTPRELNHTYEYSDEDRNSVLSVVSNMDKFIQENYASESGFNHAKFNEDAFWLNSKNREKAISSIIQKVRAEVVEEVLKNRGNASFKNQESLPNSNKEGIKVMSIKELFNKR